MKKNSQINGNHTQKGIVKGLLTGLPVGAFLGFLVAFIMCDGKLPFADSHSVIGNMKELVTVFYLFSVAGGAVLGLSSGFIIGAIVDAYSK